MSKSAKVLVLTLSVFFALLVVTETKAQTLPAGSYQQSCSEMKVIGSMLYGKCKQIKEGSFLVPTLKDFFLCNGDISNNNGTLVCNTLGESTPLKKAKKAFTDSYKKTTGAMLSSDDFRKLLRAYFDGNKGATGLFYKGIVPSTADTFMAQYIRRSDQGDLRLAMINRVFDEVFGRTPSSQEVATNHARIMGGGTTYSTLFAEQMIALSTNKIVRRLMITAAYKRSFGRPATVKELDYWETKTENFKQLVAVSRTWLYSTSGATELTETIDRSIFNKTGEKATKEQIANGVIKFTKTKAIYSEM